MNGSSARHARGFNLVELLIVIAIFGILTIIILIAVYQARLKAYDNRIRSSVGQIRWLTEQMYDTNAASYQGWATEDNADIAAELQLLLEDIDKNYGETDPATHVTLLRDSQRKDFCISAPLRGEAGNWYCIDATGVFTTVGSACPDYAQTDPTPLRCPAS